MNYCSFFGKVQTDDRQTESDAYEPTVQLAQVQWAQKLLTTQALFYLTWHATLHNIIHMKYCITGKSYIQ